MAFFEGVPAFLGYFLGVPSFFLIEINDLLDSPSSNFFTPSIFPPSNKTEDFELDTSSSHSPDL